MDDLPEYLKDAPEWVKNAEREDRQRRLETQQALKQEQLEKSNLNQAYVRGDIGYIEFCGPGPGAGVVADYSTVGEDQTTCVYFKNLEKHVIAHIKGSEVVVGCVAWLTNEQILKALAQKRGVSLIVQKEDFLRPDITSENNWTSRLRQWYNKLPKTLDRRDFNTTILGDMGDRNIDQLIDPVRCVGNYNASRQSAFPRSHHKVETIIFTGIGNAKIISSLTLSGLARSTLQKPLRCLLKMPSSYKMQRLYKHIFRNIRKSQPFRNRLIGLQHGLRPSGPSKHIHSSLYFCL